MTLAVPEELHKKMDKFDEIRWSAVAREAFERKVSELETMNKILKDSELTEADAEEIGNKIKAEIRKRFEKRFGKWS